LLLLLVAGGWPFFFAAKRISRPRKEILVFPLAIHFDSAVVTVQNENFLPTARDQTERDRYAIRQFPFKGKYLKKPKVFRKATRNEF
jgi:hypothetical protein